MAIRWPPASTILRFVEDARGDLQSQDTDLAPDRGALPAAVLSGDQPLRGQQPVGLVPGSDLVLPDARQLHCSGARSFRGRVWRLSGREFSGARLINDIYEAASSSIAWPVSDKNVAITISVVLFTSVLSMRL